MVAYRKETRTDFPLFLVFHFTVFYFIFYFFGRIKNLNQSFQEHNKFAIFILYPGEALWWSPANQGEEHSCVGQHVK